MPGVANLPPVVRKYLEELELHLKRKPGVSPEEALSDAREFLTQEAEALARSGEGPNEADHSQWIVNHFGAPSEVARQYAELSSPFVPRQGYAPGWRICCTRCGRSAPLASIGAIRIGAKSIHKYTVGYCKDCEGLRFLRIIQDLDTPNLTQKLGLLQTPDQLRRTMHQPVATIVSILVAVLGFLILALGIVAMAVATARFANGQDMEINRVAFEKLSDAVRLDYSYVNRRKTDWSSRFTEYRPRFVNASGSQAFVEVAADCLKEAEDAHLWLQVDGKTIATYRKEAQPNFNPRLLPKMLTRWKQYGKTVIIGLTPEGHQYVLISTWDHREPDSMKVAIEAVRESAQKHTPLIIDVRPNSGGDEAVARKVAGFFVDQPRPYASHSMRNAGKDSPLQHRLVSPTEVGVKHQGKCVVLMGPVNMSSCESFLLMMRAAGVRLIGQTSRGSSGNPKPHILGNGVTAFIPSWQDFDLKGNLIEGNGIKPDIKVEVDPSELAKSDKVLDKARAVLSE